MVFGVGNIRDNIIHKNKKNYTATYSVESIRDLTNAIIPHFNKYPLITQKSADFELFKMVVELMSKKKHLTTEGLHKIISIRASMNFGLSNALKIAFPYITPVARPQVELPKNINLHWLAGFTEAEGCFHCAILQNTTFKLGSQTKTKI